MEFIIDNGVYTSLSIVIIPNGNICISHEGSNDEDVSDMSIMIDIKYLSLLIKALQQLNK